MPKGFVDFPHFVQDLKAAVGSTRMPLRTPAERHDFAKQVLCEMLALEEKDFPYWEYLVDHASDENSGVLRRIINQDDTPETERRLQELYKEIVDFENNRDKCQMPRKVAGEPPLEADT